MRMDFNDNTHDYRYFIVPMVDSHTEHVQVKMDLSRLALI